LQRHPVQYHELVVVYCVSSIEPDGDARILECRDLCESVVRRFPVSHDPDLDPTMSGGFESLGDLAGSELVARHENLGVGGADGFFDDGEGCPPWGEAYIKGSGGRQRSLGQRGTALRRPPEL